MNKVIISGFLGIDDDDNIVITKSNKYYKELLIDIIEDNIKTSKPSTYKVKDEDEDYEYGYMPITSYFIPNCNIKFYISDNEISLDEVSMKYTMKLMGDIDAYGECYGYSEYSIEGFLTENFSIGNHDLNEIFSNYDGKYINLVIEY